MHAFASKRRRRARVDFNKDAALQLEFLEAAHALAQGAPQHPAELVHWWGPFKEALFQLCARLQRSHRMKHRYVYAGETANSEASSLRAEAGMERAVAEVLAARPTLSLAVTAERAAAPLSPCRDWLQDNGRPSPSLTAHLNPAAAPSIAVLRSATGGVASGDEGCAQSMASYWAAVSSCTGVMDLEAPATAIATLGEAPQVSEADCAHLSKLEVTGADVAKALRRIRPGKSRGPDGLPREVYRHFKQVFLPLLARVFEAIMRDMLIPPGFQDSVTIFRPKPLAEDGSRPAGFRSLTLLNADHFVFARLLALRLKRAPPNGPGCRTLLGLADSYWRCRPCNPSLVAQPV